MDAISRLGYSKLKRFALSQAFAKVFRFGASRGGLVPRPGSNLHSSAVGMAAELIADALPVEEAEHAFLCGLMHDIGKLLIAVALPDQWQRIDTFAVHGGSPMEKEQELLGVSHAELSAMAAERWKLPHPVCDAIRRHHSPTLENAKTIPLSRLVQASNSFVNSLGITVMNLKPEGGSDIAFFQRTLSRPGTVLARVSS